MRAPFPLLAASLLLTACADLAGRDRQAVEPLMPVVSAPAVPLPERKPAPPPRRPPAKPLTSPAVGSEALTAAELEQAGRSPDPHPISQALTGLSSDEVRAVMGPPAQEFAEAPGVRWRYLGQDCILDVHLFPRVESQGLFALEVAAEGLPAALCLDSFRAPPATTAPRSP